MPRIVAYHVSSDADLGVVERRVCTNGHRDGLLYGANVAGFTTTLFMGHLPDFSPYPCAEDEGYVGYRYVTSFNPDKFYKFKMAQTAGQVRYLLLKKSIPPEKRLAKRLREKIPDNEDEDWDRFFPNGLANDYSYKRRFENQYAGPYFVNVMFWHGVHVREPESEDDHRVVKEGPTFPREQVDALDDNEWLASLNQDEGFNMTALAAALE